MTPSQSASPALADGDAYPVALCHELASLCRLAVRLPLRGQLRLEGICATYFFLIPVELS